MIEPLPEINKENRQKTEDMKLTLNAPMILLLQVWYKINELIEAYNKLEARSQEMFTREDT